MSGKEGRKGGQLASGRLSPLSRTHSLTHPPTHPLTHSLAQYDSTNIERSEAEAKPILVKVGSWRALLQCTFLFLCFITLHQPRMCLKMLSSIRKPFLPCSVQVCCQPVRAACMDSYDTAQRHGAYMDSEVLCHHYPPNTPLLSHLHTHSVPFK
mgnify:FL=1